MAMGPQHLLHQRHQPSGDEHKGQTSALEFGQKRQETRARGVLTHVGHHALQVVGRQTISQGLHALAQVDLELEELRFEFSPKLWCSPSRHRIEGVDAGDSAIKIAEHRGGRAVHGGGEVWP